MKKRLLILIGIISLGIQISRGKSNLENLNLKPLVECNDELAIRIKEGQLIIDISVMNECVSAELILSAKDQHQRNILSAKKSKELLDSLLSKGITSLEEDSYKGIDGTTTFIETVVDGKYHKVSYWSARSGASGTTNDKDRETVKSIILFTQDFLHTKTHWDSFYDTLEPGIYYGSNLDRFLPENIAKSDLYSKVERCLHYDFCLDEKSSSKDFPLIVIGRQYYSLEELNKYSSSDIDTIEALKPDNVECALFGFLGKKNGVIRIRIEE